MATNACLISGSAHFASKKASDARFSHTPTLKPIKLQLSCSFFSSISSPLKISFNRKGPILKVYVISAQQEENNPVFLEEEGQGFKADLDWEAPANEESYGSVELSEEAKVYVGNFPYDVDGEKLVQLFGQAGVVEIAEDFNGRLLSVGKATPIGSHPERSPQRFERTYKIYARNLPWSVDDSRLKRVFIEHGKVIYARVVCDRGDWKIPWFWLCNYVE